MMKAKEISIFESRFATLYAYMFELVYRSVEPFLAQNAQILFLSNVSASFMFLTMYSKTTSVTFQ